MSNQPAAYTPLETLLLFQYLRKRGIESSAFNGISDDLRAIPLIRNDPTYDDARLTPDALRALYLQLLKDEAKRDLEQQQQQQQQLDASSNAGDLSPPSRKRKAHSPKLPTIHDAAKHAHLIPQLITRLYARWREIMISDIRGYEARYEQATRDIAEIKAGKWDVRLQEQNSIPTQTTSTMAVPPLVQAADAADSVQKPLIPARNAAVIHQTANKPPDRAAIGHIAPQQRPPQQQYQSYPSQPQTVTAYQHQQQQQRSPSAAHTFPLVPAQLRGNGSPVVSTYTTTKAPISPRPILPPEMGVASQAPPAHSASPMQAHPRLQPQLPPQQNVVYAPHLQNGQQAHYSPQQAQHQAPRFSQQQQQQQLQYQGQHPVGGYTPQYPTSATQDSSRHQHIQNQQQQHQQQQLQQNAYSTPQGSPYRVVNDIRPQAKHRVSMNDVVERLKRPQTPTARPRTPVWKSESKPAPIPRPTSPTRPTQFEPVSPVLLHPTPSPTRTRTRKEKQESVANSEDLSRRTRSVSLASTTADEKPNTRRRVKQEASSSAAPFVADSEEPEILPPGTSSNARTRRGTSFQGKAAITMSSVAKRKRQQSLDNDEEDFPQSHPSTIQATRNFTKVSSTLMNGIIGHKHGSRFTQPVRDRDADGYSSFIKRPQDLKSIRAAISHGARAIAAATANAESPAPETPGGSKSADNVVELERSVDLMPPKAIINAAQLEKEIMRMLANAVMFNPGEDGMVADTREMFDKVEELIDQWRGVERDATVVEEEEENSRKKRKV